jgi:surface carbohydrate biosynthesis protein (TIGR04326 family)
VQQSDAPPLWVCWRKPTTEIPRDAVVLSFLPPDVEEELAKTVRIERARELSQEIRPDARRAYLDLVAAIGIADCGGKTFRQRLEKPGAGSRWWYHPVAFRDCEDDPTFNSIIAILTVAAAADRLELRNLVLVGAPNEIVAVLRSRFNLRAIHTTSARRVLSFVKASARRARNLLRQSVLSLRPIPLPAGPIGAFFSAFWDWSFELAEDGSIRDRYYRDLPSEIERQGVGRPGWLVWIDSTKKVSLARARASANRPAGANAFVCLQSLLHPKDVFAAHADLGPLWTVIRFRRSLRKATVWNRYEFAALFNTPLLDGCLNESLPNAELTTKATERAHRRYIPKAFFSFLEHFPHARASYQGIAQSEAGTATFATQHASYNREKTFLSLDPVIEFRGEPDGCAVPHPDYVCAMGEVGRDLFLACGYADSHVLLTGSPRYDMLQSRKLSARHRLDDSVNVLMVATLNLPMELEMMHAVAASARDLPRFRLRLRCHPARRIRQEDAAACGVEITTGSLDEDLTNADVVLFTYSTVAEEAFIAGRPAWQWLPMGFDGSALAEAARIPRFGSVAKLREALIKFAKDRNRFIPDAAARASVFRKLFFEGSGSAARVASHARRIVENEIVDFEMRKGSAS